MANIDYADERLDKGDSTVRNWDKLYDNSFLFDVDNITEEHIKELINLAPKSPFLEGVAKHLQIFGVKCTAKDTSIILEEITRRYKRRIGDTCPKAIRNWASGHNAPSMNKNKINHYNLCYALEMGYEETKEFFVKCFFLQPFNYKITTDAIFYYCLKRKRPYSVIREMLKKEKETSDFRDSPEHTTEVQRQIDEIDNDDEFMQFLSSYCYTPEQLFQRARNTICSLIDTYTQDGGYAQLNEKITDIKYQSQLKDKKNTILPIEFTRSLPTDKTFGDIRKGVEESYETMRKTLIILSFYDYYRGFYDRKTNWKLEALTEKEAQTMLGELADILDDRLVDCGFAPLYEKNLFDMMIIFCAKSPCPLDTYKEIVGLRYPNQDT